MALRIGLISAPHIPEARAALWPQIAGAFADVDMIFHGGDIHELWVLDELECVAPVYAARGNGEDGSGGRPVQPEDPRVKPIWTWELEGVSVLLTHYVPVPEQPPHYTLAWWLARNHSGDPPDVIVSGDSHVEHIERIGKTLCVNPGSALYPHNYNTQLGTIGFLELDTGAVSASVWLLTERGIAPFDWGAEPPWKLRP